MRPGGVLLSISAKPVGNPVRSLAIFLAWAIFISCCAEFDFAQQIVLNGTDLSLEELSDSYDLYSDRILSRGVDRAKASIAKGEYSQAIRFLDQVLAEPQDGFVDLDDAGGYVGLKKIARELIRDLPPEGKSLYESLFSAAAAKKLSRALASGDRTGVEEVSRRFFYTPAGFQATLLVAKNHADGGRHREALALYHALQQTPEAVRQLDPELELLTSQSLLALGQARAAGNLIAELERNSAAQSATTVLAGEEQILRDGSLNWFDRHLGKVVPLDGSFTSQWLVRGGDPARNARSGGGLPHMRVRWQARLISHPQLEEVYKELAELRKDRGTPLPTTNTTLAIGNTIVATTPHNVVAVDLQSGKRIWQTQTQRESEFEQLMGTVDSDENQDLSVEPVQSFAKRLWQDHQHNSISSNGKLIFVLRDLNVPDLSQADVFGRFGGFGNAFIDNQHLISNRLCAYDLQTQGKLLWEIDGAAAEGELAGSYFLGAPLPVGDRLYCLVEIKSSIHLMEIDPTDGTVLGIQQLADLHRNIVFDQLRSLQAVMPSYESGILVCPTGAGVVIAVDVEKSSIAWYYPFENNDSVPVNRRRRSRRRRRSPSGQWLDSTATIADGRVLITPPESDQLYCLDLATGKLLWPLERSDALFLAGVDDGRVLVVGEHAYTLYALATGKPLWPEKSRKLPAGTTPSGRGFFNQGKYFLPLSSAEVISIDLRDGRIVSRAISSMHQVPGNLIAHQGTILSNNGIHLECFDQIEVLKRRTEELLAQDPHNDVALRTLGEIAYNEGRLEDAIDVLQKSFQVEPADLRTREVLGECLLEAISRDFAAYRDRLPQLYGLIQGSSAKLARLRRLESEGLLAMDQVWESFEVTADVFESSLSLDELEEVNLDYAVTPAAWLSAQTAAIWERADEATKTRILDRLQELRESTVGSDAAHSLASFTRCFSTLPSVKGVFDVQIARNLNSSGRPLDAQQWYLQMALQQSAEPAHAEAVAACMQSLWQCGYRSEAGGFQAELSGELAQRTCMPDKTGKQILVDLGAPAEVVSHPWPYGKTKVSSVTAGSAELVRKRQQPFSYARFERSDPVLERNKVFFSNKEGISIRDRFGREVFQSALPETRFFNIQDVYATSRGNLLIISFGNRITALNTLVAPGEETDCLLWSKSLIARGNERNFYIHSNRRPTTGRPGSFRTSRAQSEGKWIGVLGPLTRDCFVYQDQRGLHCVDPMTGRLRWSRSDADNACDLIGDDQIVIAVPETGTESHLYHTQDGRDLGSIELPEWRTQLCARGTELVIWKKTDAGYELAALDAPTGSVKWSKPFAQGAKVAVALNRYVVVVDPAGEYSVLDLDSTKEIVRYRSPNGGVPGQVMLIPGKDQFVVAVQKQFGDPVRKTRSWSQGLDAKLFSGELMAFDVSDGSALWERPAEIPQQLLLESQPVDLPVVAFLGNYRGQDRSGIKQATSLLLLEKSSGRVLFQRDDLPATGNYHTLWVDQDKSELTVDMLHETVQVELTNLPRPPFPPALHDTGLAGHSGPQGLYKIMRQFWSKN